MNQIGTTTFRELHVLAVFNSTPERRVAAATASVQATSDLPILRFPPPIRDHAPSTSGAAAAAATKPSPVSPVVERDYGGRITPTPSSQQDDVNDSNSDNDNDCSRLSRSDSEYGRRKSEYGRQRWRDAEYGKAGLKRVGESRIEDWYAPLPFFVQYGFRVLMSVTGCT